jgi:REP element-mobilizing transposase RayT
MGQLMPGVETRLENHLAVLAIDEFTVHGDLWHSVGMVHEVVRNFTKGGRDLGGAVRGWKFAVLRTAAKYFVGAGWWLSNIWPMVAGFHIICTNYGFWLPNDERGSGSDFVRAPALKKFGPTNPVTTRRSVANKPFDFRVREMARASLRYPPVTWNGRQALCIALAFKEKITRYGGLIFACSILPDHFHVITAPHRYDIRRLAARLKGEATKRLRSENLYPGEVPSPWGRLPWVIYLWTQRDVIRCIRYVEDNPVKAGLKRQRWSFVTPYLAAVRSTAYSKPPNQ